MTIQRTVRPGRRAMPIERQDVRLVGRSTAVRRIEDAIQCAAHSDAGAFVTGEEGVGKAFVARLIHRRGPRASAAMVALTCASLPDCLLESELFGHVRGGFTGAYRDKPGTLETAPNGTLFLDDAGELGTRTQAALLRFLESGEIQRVGADRSHLRVDVRVIAASRLDLRARVESGAFRDELYAGLTAIRITIPPLRERTEDIPLLLESFLHAYSQAHEARALDVSSEAMQALVGYQWPGNVRELQMVVERLVLEVQGSVVRLCDLPPAISGLSAPAIAPSPRSTADARATRSTPEGGGATWRIGLRTGAEERRRVSTGCRE